MSQTSLKPEGWMCHAFPDQDNGYHFLTVIAIQISIMFPVKMTLTRHGGSLRTSTRTTLKG